jgi:hypothetical protein
MTWLSAKRYGLGRASHGLKGARECGCNWKLLPPRGHALTPPSPPFWSVGARRKEGERREERGDRQEEDEGGGRRERGGHRRLERGMRMRLSQMSAV